MKTEFVRQQQYADLLRRVPRFALLNDEIVNSIADVMEEAHYGAGDYIVRQGARGDTFYVIAKGCVKEMKRKGDAAEDELITTLHSGEFFGEGALVAEETRSANFVAGDPDGADCLVIDRETFSQLMEKLNEVSPSASRLLDEVRPPSGTDSGLQSIQLASLSYITTIGVGGFGRVELVQLTTDPSRTFAIKKMKKHHIVEMRQQEHILNEKHIMAACNSEFIVRLFKTFKDNKYLYMLLEACLGGELWTLLRDKNCFDDSTTRFYTGCVVEAFSYLHSQAIVYRDLKPENLLLDNIGYAKLVDFGFAKKVGHGRKTWTFCGTPEYVAPEIILNRGHDTSSDLWSLGILMFELLTGSPPFSGSDPMKTYAMILKGISVVDFPRKITKNAQQIIKKLCKNDPSERLGYGTNGMKDIYKHKWFDGFNWEALRRRTLKAPYLPQVRSATDTSNFDTYSADESGVPPDDLSGWDRDF
jgi:cGMP-dependent protein kinase